MNNGECNKHVELKRRKVGILSCGKQIRYTFAITAKGRVKVKGFRQERTTIPD